MSKIKKRLRRFLSGSLDHFMEFDELLHIMRLYEFEERIAGDHHIFIKEDAREVINLQSNNGMAKPYQVKQVREFILNTPTPPLILDDLVKYEIVIFWSEEHDCFLAEVPELPGCKADGNTYAEALNHVEGIIEEWMAVANELGWSIPEPKGRLLFA